MSGYSGYSMSNNAVTAYANGERPLSKWTKEDILLELPEELQIAAKKLTIKEARMLFLRWSSWHHTSSMYNRTDFYIVESDSVTVSQIRDVIASREPKADKHKEKVEKTKARVLFGEWTGTRKHPKLTERESYAVIIGNWAYLPDGGKKRTDGKHFRVLGTFPKAPRGSADTFKQIDKHIRNKAK